MKNKKNELLTDATHLLCISTEIVLRKLRYLTNSGKIRFIPEAITIDKLREIIVKHFQLQKSCNLELDYLTVFPIFMLAEFIGSRSRLS